MKGFLDIVELTGYKIPVWILIIILVVLAIIGVYKLIKDIIIPKIEAYIKVRDNIKSIPEIKEKQEIIRQEQQRAIQKSIEGDKAVNERIDNMDSKLDKIVNALDSLQTHNDEQKTIAENQSTALKMMLANELDKRYRRYLELQYIPDKEFDEYVHTYESYKALGGNSTGEAKFNYVMEHLERKV